LSLPSSSTFRRGPLVAFAAVNAATASVSIVVSLSRLPVVLRHDIGILAVRLVHPLSIAKLTNRHHATHNFATPSHRRRTTAALRQTNSPAARFGRWVVPIGSNRACADGTFIIFQTSASVPKKGAAMPRLPDVKCPKCSETMRQTDLSSAARTARSYEECLRKCEKCEVGASNANDSSSVTLTCR
jgi:hypothetical protein